MPTNSEYNTAIPSVMHIDLNSCFATVEQQARPLLRGKPVAVVNRRTEHTMIVTASYEAKALGVKLGMSVKEAKKICPDLVCLESDPPKYRYVYHQLMRIMSDYSAHFTMKSIDEGVIDFGQSSREIVDRGLLEIALEIKQRLRQEIGCAMRCNVGIATNRFLAKTAASLNKPDGLDVIDHKNLRDVYDGLDLEDLTGIAERNRARLEQIGIMTPLEFLDAQPEVLQKVVFKSICGLQWHQRLRGWEVDDYGHDIKTCGRQYVLEKRGMDREEIEQRLHRLCEDVGAKLRSQKKFARGVGVYARVYGSSEGTRDSNGRWGRKGSYWHQKHLAPLPFFSDSSIWNIARTIFRCVPAGDVREIGVHVYHLHDSLDSQLPLFADDMARDKAVSWSIDEINGRWGKRSVHSANTISADQIMKEKIPFGSTRYL